MRIRTNVPACYFVPLQFRTRQCPCSIGGYCIIHLPITDTSNVLQTPNRYVIETVLPCLSCDNIHMSLQRICLRVDHILGMPLLHTGLCVFHMIGMSLQHYVNEFII